MNNPYLAQYLLNEGKMTKEEVAALLKKCEAKKTSFVLQMICDGLLEGKEASGWEKLSDEAAIKALTDKGLVTSAQAKEIKDDLSNSLVFSQVLIDEGIYGYAEIDALWKEFGKAADPVKAAVKKLICEELEPESEVYGNYLGYFFQSLRKLLGVQAVISPEKLTIDDLEASDGLNIVSQGIGGDKPLITALAAKDTEFLAFAQRYSDENISVLDDLAIDSMHEFLNVINGIFTVEMSKRNIDADLETLRAARCFATPMPLALPLRLLTSLGDIYLILAPEEVIPAGESIF